MHSEIAIFVDIILIESLIVIVVLPEPLMISVFHQQNTVPVQGGNYTIEIGRSRRLLCITNTTVVGSFSPVLTYWASSNSTCTFTPFSKYCYNREHNLIFVVLRLSTSVKTAFSRAQKKCWLSFCVIIEKYSDGSAICLCQ